jgi:hypothetical protein
MRQYRGTGIAGLQKGNNTMPRYLVERSFDDGLNIPINEDGAAACRTVVGGNANHQVTWIHSYVTEDKGKTYCIYDGPDANAIRQAAAANGLPVDSITKVTVLDPYFYS